jgi:hypothetical protein
MGRKVARANWSGRALHEGTSFLFRLIKANDLQLMCVPVNPDRFSNPDQSLDLSLSNPTSPTLTLLLMPLSLSLSTHLLTLLHPLTPFLPPSSAATAAASSVTSTSPIKGRGTPARTAYIDNIIQRAFVGTWAYRTGGEEGDAARELASWLASPDDKRGRWFLDVLGGWQVVRHLGVRFSSLCSILTDVLLSLFLLTADYLNPSWADFVVHFRPLVDLSSFPTDSSPIPPTAPYNLIAWLPSILPLPLRPPHLNNPRPHPLPRRVPISCRRMER